MLKELMSNNGQTVCKAQRSDAGYLGVYPVMISNYPNMCSRFTNSWTTKKMLYI